jgi:hypothetical protein
MWDSDDGEWVLYADHAAEVEHLRGLLREALAELEGYNPDGASPPHRIRREIGWEKP